MHYNRSLQISESIFKANPDSAAAARDVVISHFKLAQFAIKNKDSDAAARHWKACYEILNPRISVGLTFDPPVMRVYEVLKKTFGNAK